MDILKHCSHTVDLYSSNKTLYIRCIKTQFAGTSESLLYLDIFKQTSLYWIPSSNISRIPSSNLSRIPPNNFSWIPSKFLSWISSYNISSENFNYSILNTFKQSILDTINQISWIPWDSTSLIYLETVYIWYLQTLHLGYLQTVHWIPWNSNKYLYLKPDSLVMKLSVMTYRASCERLNLLRQSSYGTSCSYTNNPSRRGSSLDSCLLPNSAPARYSGVYRKAFSDRLVSPPPPRRARVVSFDLSDDEDENYAYESDNEVRRIFFLKTEVCLIILLCFIPYLLLLAYYTAYHSTLHIIFHTILHTIYHNMLHTIYNSILYTIYHYILNTILYTTIYYTIYHNIL